MMVAAMSFSLTAASPHSVVDTEKITTFTHAVATVHLVARPAIPDQPSAPVTAVVLAVALGFVLIGHRRVVPHRAYQVRRPSGRAPPGPLAHH